MCDERERLIGFVYDECDAGERRAIEEHVDACPTCRTEIAALRDVREDLLAWRVPLHEPIWRPLPVAAAPSVPWWRQVPAWALAAAASVMFFSGVAGGAIAAAWLRPAAATVSARVADDAAGRDRGRVDADRAAHPAAHAAGTQRHRPACPACAVLGRRRASRDERLVVDGAGRAGAGSRDFNRAARSGAPRGDHAHVKRRRYGTEGLA